MSWQFVETYPWTEPLEALAAMQDEAHLSLLYSGLENVTRNHTSYFGWGCREVKTASKFGSLPPCSPKGTHDLPEWFGYLAYEMRGDVEPTKRLKPCPISMPDMRWVGHLHLLSFQHNAKEIAYYVWADTAPLSAPWQAKRGTTASVRYELEELLSNFSSSGYKKTLRDTVAEIHAGNFYQANITRKYMGAMDRDIDPVGIFTALSKISPAPYSALLKTPDDAIISSSPECFLRATSDGALTVKPIKGSARRGRNDDEDASIVLNLAASDKDHAENLMIVDLMRHDLARISEPASVKLEEYAGLYSYATIHHLISTIHAQKKADVPLADALRALFPPGSMTGAPKIAAMDWCAKHEAVERGVYSGALGWLGAGESCDLSVVIRTVITRGKQFEFQAGGGIVADSNDEKELAEMFLKLKAVAEALAIDDQLLKSI